MVHLTIRISEVLSVFSFSWHKHPKAEFRTLGRAGEYSSRQYAGLADPSNIKQTGSQQFRIWLQMYAPGIRSGLPGFDCCILTTLTVIASPLRVIRERGLSHCKGIVVEK